MGVGKEMGGYKEGTPTSTVSSVPIVGQYGTTTTPKGQPETGYPAQGDVYTNGVASSIFSWPATAGEVMQCLYELLLILIVLYIIGSIMESVLYKGRFEGGKSDRENVRKRFFAKWGAVAIGLVLALIGAYALQEWCLVLPLVVLILTTLAWTFTSAPKREQAIVTPERK